MANGQLVLIFVASVCFFSTTVWSLAMDTVTLRLYSKDYSYIEVKTNNASELVPHMNLSVKTLIYCHGYRQSTDTDIVVQLIHSFIDNFDYNILAVDYRYVTLRDYLSSVYLSSDVANSIVHALTNMVAAGLNKEGIEFYGHSLGAQVSGKVGRNLPFPLFKITGMDPAGPLYTFIGQSLSASDALCVICIHTDMGFYGNAKSCEHIDFYPNGGSREQPGCPGLSLEDPVDGCSHERSELYTLEAVKNPHAFLGIKCDSWYDFKNGNCNGSRIIPMGEATPCSATGSYYLVTNKKEPFGMGEEGTVYHV